MIIKRILPIIAMCIGLQQSLMAAEGNFFTRISNRVCDAIAAHKTTLVRSSIAAVTIAGLACAAYGYYTYQAKQSMIKAQEQQEQKDKFKIELKKLIPDQTNDDLASISQLPLWNNIQQSLDFPYRIALGQELVRDNDNTFRALAFASFAFNAQEMAKTEHDKLYTSITA